MTVDSVQLTGAVQSLNVLLMTPTSRWMTFAIVGLSLLNV